VRCGLSKDFLAGKLSNTENNEHLQSSHPSQIKFKEENLVDFDLGIGCGIFVYMGSYSLSQSRPPKDLVRDQELWKNWRSFYLHGNGSLKLGFKEASSGQLRVAVEDGGLDIQSLKIYRGENEVKEEEDEYRDIIQA